MEIGNGLVDSLYTNLQFPLEHGRPYVIMNMVTTIDGKSVVAGPKEIGGNLGSAVDKLLMRRIQQVSDAVLIGAVTQRNSPDIHYDERLIRIVVTHSGNLLWNSRFFKDAPARAIALCPEQTSLSPPISGVKVLRSGKTEIDWLSAIRTLYRDLGIKVLLVEGGANVNGQLLRLEIVDELFLTIAPRVKLGVGLPTYADGEPFPAQKMPRFKLLEAHRVDDEVFLRYRRA
ncbi:MAG: RibD family protein [Candidatus Caldarchaeum sp.]